MVLISSRTENRDNSITGNGHSWNIRGWPLPENKIKEI